MAAKNTQPPVEPYLVGGYLPTVGIECHVQLATKTKLFTAVSNQFDPQPNSAIGPLCLGLPGTLPVLNRQAVDLAITAGLALEAEIASPTHFDRKHYFYPDLPLGYQISQHQRPIVVGGQVSFWSTTINQQVVVELERAHLEADAGKLSHPPGVSHSLVDFNRVGAPLLEVVSRPMIHSPADARNYAHELYRLMVYAGVCEGNLFLGQVRFDVNISLARPDEGLGVRTEIKNLNSFRFVEQAMRFEVDRQLKRLQAGEAIVQETRGWDETKKATFSQRSKEEAPDYRYMPDPDLPPVEIDDQMIASLRQQIPVLPAAIRQILSQAQLPGSTIETILDWPAVAGWLATATGGGQSLGAIKVLANWLIGELWRQVKQEENDWPKILAAENDLWRLAAAVDDGQVSPTRAKDFLGRYWSGADLDGFLAEADQSGEVDNWRAVVAEVLAANPQAVADARVDPKAAGFLVGQVKRRLSDSDPVVIRQLIDDYLNSNPPS